MNFNNFFIAYTNGRQDFSNETIWGGDEETIDGLIFKDVNFTKSNLEEISFDNCQFVNCNFTNAIVDYTTLIECKFIDCNMLNADFATTELINCTCSNCPAMVKISDEVYLFHHTDFGWIKHSPDGWNSTSEYDYLESGEYIDNSI